MEPFEKKATAGTMANDKTTFLSKASDGQCILLRCHDVKQTDTCAVRLYETKEAALRESQIRIQSL
ncbi:hypothetical protein SporoP37_15700 [Sporosarcina sp. P37]|uniref:hypothetical protein n=1 Tax=unclassified Sporosarcina TaxID=2647733 RepID=UPI000A17A519|nr:MULTISPECIES: hypothetical protein [unclassified Sporosarcina]ARK25972.1 hypothetical protein SporoP37_15700 [Sporosarcina sp. P37]PID19340.1 hypothetical protein CSV62_02220 [Sporosarcina sp. P35]